MSYIGLNSTVNIIWSRRAIREPIRGLSKFQIAKCQTDSSSSNRFNNIIIIFLNLWMVVITNIIVSRFNR